MLYINYIMRSCAKGKRKDVRSAGPDDACAILSSKDDDDGDNDDDDDEEMLLCVVCFGLMGE